MEVSKTMRSLSTTSTTAILAGALLLAGVVTAACGNESQEADAGNAEAEKQAATGEKVAEAEQTGTSKEASSQREDAAQKVAKADAEAATNGGNGSDKPYTVECPEDDGACKVDEKTYEGWKAFSGFCERCHGPGGLGSSIGPNLVERINQKPIEKSRFIQVVSAGWDGPADGKMPAFGQNPNVNDKFDNLWAYLKARADGKIGPGRPDQIGATGPGEGAPGNWE